MTQLKEIHSFDVIRKVTKEVTEETEQGKLTKKVEVEAPIKVIIKKPSRVEAEKADEEYAIEYARCIRLGMLTDALIDKHYANEHGFLSKDDQERYAKQYVKFLELQQEFQATNSKQKKTKKDQDRLKEITREWFEIERDLEELQAARNNLYSNTAETKARDKTITWLSLFLTYVQVDGNDPVPFYEGSTEAEKLNSYDELIEKNEDHAIEIISKSSLYVSLWYMNKLKTPEDFKNFESLMINKSGLEALSAEEQSESKEEKETPVEASA